MQVNDGPPVDPRDAGDSGAAAEAGCRGRGGVVLGSASGGRRRAVLDRPAVRGDVRCCRGAVQRWMDREGISPEDKALTLHARVFYPSRRRPGPDALHSLTPLWCLAVNLEMQSRRPDNSSVRGLEGSRRRGGITSRVAVDFFFA
jgi:hypothetical protein